MEGSSEGGAKVEEGEEGEEVELRDGGREVEREGGGAVFLRETGVVRVRNGLEEGGDGGGSDLGEKEGGGRGRR